MTSSKDDSVVTEQSDVLSSDEIEAAYQRWEAPTMVSVTDIEEGRGPLTVKDFERLQKEAEQEGHQAGFEQGQAAGYQAGLKTAQQEINQQVTYLKQMMTTLNTPLVELDEQIEQDLMSLVMTMTRQLVRRELKAEPEHVIGAVRAAMAVLPINDRKLKIFLHPQDVELVKTGLSIEDEGTNWQWIEDPLLTRGGVKLVTANTTIDATVETRINTVINKLLGEERSDDSAK